MEQFDGDLLLKRFLALFPQRFGSTFRAIGATTWRAMSQFHYLEDHSILGSLGSSSKNVRACLLDEKTIYLALSCPTGDEGTDIEAAGLVVKQLRGVGLKPNLYREAASSAIQIFLAFSELVETDYAAAVIASYLENKTVVIHDTKTPFVLPLQQGFAWLNDNFSTKVECDQISIEAAMAMFLHDLNSNSVPSDVLESLANTEKTISSTEVPLLETVEEIEFEIGQPVVEEILEELPESYTDLDIHEPATILFPPAEFPGAAQATVPRGQQLLLFPNDPQVLQFELPKERPKRNKLARSDLPADIESAVFESTLFKALPTDAPSVMQTLKEAADH